MHAPAADVFVSYKAEDRGRVKALVDALEAEGFTVWWDTHIGGGAHWREDIQDHLDAAKCVIVVWTKRSVGPEGDFVRDEAALAKHRGIYLPVHFDAVELPLGFREVQAISLKGWHGNRSDARFSALADAVRECITGEHVERHHAHYDRGISRRAAIVGGGGAAGVALAGVAAWELLNSSTAVASGSIAVLPFANLSGDPNQAYFSDGISDEIRSALTRIAGLTVIGSTSSEAVRNDDARTAAKKLGVASILTGNVRKSPSIIRVSAELIDGRSGADRWTQNYDRNPGDSIKIQTDIAENVATALKGALGLAAQAAITLGGTSDSLAQDLILRSRNLGHQSSSLDTLRRRLALAEEAIARDPNYADAYVDKAFMVFVLATNFAQTPAEATSELVQAAAAANKALEIAPRLGWAHIVLAGVALGRIDFTGVLRETQRALALSPNDSRVLGSASEDVARVGNAVDALRLISHAIALDPLEPGLYDIKSEVLVYLHRYADAIEVGRKALALAPERADIHLSIGDSLLLLSQPAQAKAEYEALDRDDPLRLLRLSLLAARTGDRVGAERIIAQMKQQYGAMNSYQYGEIYAQLSEPDRAFAEWDNAINVNDSGLSFLKVDPFLDPIRSDPRYAALLRKLNFP